MWPEVYNCLIFYVSKKMHIHDFSSLRRKTIFCDATGGFPRREMTAVFSSYDFPLKKRGLNIAETDSETTRTKPN